MFRIEAFLKHNEPEHNFKTARLVRAKKFKEFLCNYERLSGILITRVLGKNENILKANENFHYSNFGVFSGYRNESLQSDVLCYW